MNSRKHHFNSFLLFFIISVNLIFLSLNLEAFPYQTGWPKEFIGEINRSPVIADLDGDKLKEIIFTVHGDVRIYVYKSNGDVFNGSWPKSFGYYGASSPTVADLDNDGDLEIILAGDRLYAWHHTGDLVNGFPTIETNFYINASPAVGDITGDNLPEIASGSSDCMFYVWDNQGNVLSGFPKTFSYLGKDSCYVKFSPAIGDIDLDGINEVIVQVDNYHVYAYNADGSIVSGIWDFTPIYGNPESDITVCDIDNDNILEVLFIANPQAGGYYPLILNHDTSDVPGWPPSNINNKTNGGLVMGDIDKDNKIEIVSGTQDFAEDAKVYVWESETGELKNGWPITLPGNQDFFRNMILGDVDGDGNIDIIGSALFGWNDGRIYAWDVNGNLLSGFPIILTGFGPYASTCFITDLDNDGDVEIGVGVCNREIPPNDLSKILIWDLPYPYKGKLMPWPQDRHDPGHTNNYHWYRPLPQVPALQPLGLFIIVTLLSVAIYLKTR